MESPEVELDPLRELGELAAALRAHTHRRRQLGRGREFIAASRKTLPAASVALPSSPGPTSKVDSANAPNDLIPSLAPRGVPTPPRTVPRPPMLPAGTSERPPPRAPASIPAALRTPSTPPAAATTPPGSAATPEGDTRARAAACADLDQLRLAVADCQACGLCKTRTKTVFGEGDPKARVLFIGEAPGEHEDLAGEPFVGAAGELLTKIIESGMGLSRSQVYIANVLKCRPPGNRDPSAEETRMCTPYLTRQIECIDPQVIIPLGKHAANFMLGFHGPAQRSMGSLRDRVFDLGARKVVPTYHPSYLLRTPEDKKATWSDIQRAMKILGLERPKTRS